eukprot:scaffold1481_cov137-Cylindrotheca_fusiformis.AAC.1
MTAVIGNDVLDIGSRKARRQRGTPMAPALAMGNPGQFDVPNVADVRHRPRRCCVHLFHPRFSRFYIF